MDILTLCGIVLSALVLIIVIKSLRPEYAFFVSIVVGIFVLTSFIGFIYPVFSYLKELYETSEYSQYFTVIIKALGIAIITYIACEICRDSGENALAAKLELAGKASILLTSLPVIKQLFGYITSFTY